MAEHDSDVSFPKSGKSATAAPESAGAGNVGQRVVSVVKQMAGNRNRGKRGGGGVDTPLLVAPPEEVDRALRRSTARILGRTLINLALAAGPTLGVACDRASRGTPDESEPEARAATIDAGALSAGNADEVSAADSSTAVDENLDAAPADAARPRTRRPRPPARLSLSNRHGVVVEAMLVHVGPPATSR